MASSDKEQRNTNPTEEKVNDTTPTEEIEVSSLMDAESLVKMTTCSPVTVTLSNDYLKHPCYVILNGGRRKELKNMEYRIYLIGGILRLHPSAFLPSLYKDDIAVKSWYKKYKPYLKHPSKWLRGIMAQAICEFDIILETASGLIALTEDAINDQPEVIKEFYAYINEVRTIAAIVENEPTPKQKRIGSQSGGKRVQDSLNMKEITREQLDLSKCANCKHNFVLPIGISQVEIHVHNENVKKTYRNKMYDYNTKSKSRRGCTKPKMGRLLTRRLACLCSRMNCLNRSDGIGCMKCEWVCIRFRKANKTSRPYFNDNGDCTCPICSCNCSVVYFRSEEKSWQRKHVKIVWLN